MFSSVPNIFTVYRFYIVFVYDFYTVSACGVFHGFLQVTEVRETGKGRGSVFGQGKSRNVMEKQKKMIETRGK